MSLLALYIVAIDDIHAVRKALKGFNKAEWKALGEELGLGEDLLDEIKANYHAQGVRECLNEVLKAWLRWNYHETSFGCPSWQSLANAVKRSGDPALAAKIWPIKH